MMMYNNPINPEYRYSLAKSGLIDLDHPDLTAEDLRLEMERTKNIIIRLVEEKVPLSTIADNNVEIGYPIAEEYLFNVIVYDTPYKTNHVIDDIGLFRGSSLRNRYRVIYEISGLEDPESSNTQPKPFATIPVIPNPDPAPELVPRDPFINYKQALKNIYPPGTPEEQCNPDYFKDELERVILIIQNNIINKKPVSYILNDRGGEIGYLPDPDFLQEVFRYNLGEAKRDIIDDIGFLIMPNPVLANPIQTVPDHLADCRDPLMELYKSKISGIPDQKCAEELARVTTLVETYLHNNIPFSGILTDTPELIGYHLHPEFLICVCDIMATKFKETIPLIITLDDVGLVCTSAGGKLIKNPDCVANYHEAMSLLKDNPLPKDTPLSPKVDTPRPSPRKDTYYNITDQTEDDDVAVPPLRADVPVGPAQAPFESQFGWNWKTYIVVGFFTAWALVNISRYLMEKYEEYHAKKMTSPIEEVSKDIDPSVAVKSEPLSEEMTKSYSPYEGFLDFPKMVELLTFLIIPPTIYMLYKSRYYYYYKYILKNDDKYNTKT